MDNKPPHYVRRIEDLPPGRHFVVLSNVVGMIVERVLVPKISIVTVTEF